MASLITSTIPSSTAAALSTTTTSLPDGTITTPIATLTTPFTPPAVSNCHPLWETTSVLTGLWDQDDHWTITTAQALISGPAADAQFQACQPSGWADVVSQSRYVFSPAVCPSGWTAYELTTFVSSAAFSTRRPLTASSAYCCAEGFSLDGGGQYVPAVGAPFTSAMCVRGSLEGGQSLTDKLSLTTTATATTTGGLVLSTTTYSRGIVTLHTAWNIIWEASDTSTLSPEPPKLTSGMYVPTWVPGTQLQKGQYTVGTHASDTDGMVGGLYYFLTIGLPLLGFAVLCCCGYFCWRSRRGYNNNSKKKKNKQIWPREAMAPPLQVESGRELQTWTSYSGTSVVKAPVVASIAESSSSGESSVTD